MLSGGFRGDVSFDFVDDRRMLPNDSSLGAPAGEVVNCRGVLEFDDANTKFAQFAQNADTMSSNRRQTGGKVLTNSEGRGIMKVGSGVRALEKLQKSYSIYFKDAT